jgi:hypothetical protein
VLTPSRQDSIAEDHRTRHQSSQSGLSQHILPPFNPGFAALQFSPCIFHQRHLMDRHHWPSLDF